MNLQLYSIYRQALGFLGKHHPVIFITVFGLILSSGIYFMYQVVLISSDTPTTAASTIGDFDQTTIDKIKNLRDSTNDNLTVQLPSPRSNPFTE